MSLCPLCQTETQDLRHGFEHFVIESIQRANPDWTESDGSCPTCIDYYHRLISSPAVEESGSYVYEEAS